MTANEGQASIPEPPQPRLTRAQKALSVVAVAVLLSYAALICSNLAPCLAGKPPTWGDSAVIYYRAQVDLALLEHTGRRTGYDPHLMAGYIHGFTNVTYPGFQAVYRVVGRVIPGPIAFGLIAIASYLLIPSLCAFGARSLGASALACLWVSVGVVAFLTLDRLGYAALRIGMFAWPLTALFVIAISLALSRLLDAPDRPAAIAAAVFLPLLSYHALAPVSLAVLTIAICASHLLRRGSPRRLAWVAAAGGVGLLVNLWWIAPLLGRLGDQGGTGESLVSGPLQLGQDLLSAVRPGSGYGGGSYALRWALLALGACGLWELRKERPAVGSALLAALAAALTLTYLGTAHPAIGRLQPYRNVILALLLASLGWPAGAARVAALWRRGPLTRVSFVLAGLLVATSVGAGVYDWTRLNRRAGSAGALEAQVIEILQKVPQGRGRVLVESLSTDQLEVGVALALSDPCLSFPTPELVGSFSVASWNEVPPRFLGVPLRELRPETIPQLLDRYAVAWVVARRKFSKVLLAAAPPGTFDQALDLHGARIYRVAKPAGWLLEGSGALRILPGRLELSELTGPVTVRFHYDPGLRALEEGVRVEPAPSGGPVPFIRVVPGDARTARIEWWD